MQQRIDAEAGDHGTGFSLVEIFLPLDASMLSRGNIHAHSVSTMHHYTIAADIDPTFVRISRDDDIAGADVSAAVSFVPEWDRKLEKIDIISLIDIFHYRTRGYPYRRDRRLLRQPFAASLNESFPRDVEGKIGSSAERRRLSKKPTRIL